MIRRWRGCCLGDRLGALRARARIADCETGHPREHQPRAGERRRPRWKCRSSRANDARRGPAWAGVEPRKRRANALVLALVPVPRPHRGLRGSMARLSENDSAPARSRQSSGAPGSSWVPRKSPSRDATDSFATRVAPAGTMATDIRRSAGFRKGSYPSRSMTACCRARCSGQRSAPGALL